jgi:O-antigen/teichoic acid export membrane protein
MAANRAAFPVLSRSVARQDGKDRLFVKTMLRGAIIIGTAAGIGALAVGEWLVDLFFGMRYQGAGYLLGLSVWLIIPRTWGGALWRVYLARGQYLFPFLGAIAGASAFTVCMLVIKDALGASGAVLSTGVGLGLWAFMLAGRLAKSGDLNLWDTSMKPIASVLPSLASFFVLKQTVNVWLALAASWAILVAGVFAFKVITPGERGEITDLAQKMLSSLRKGHHQSGSVAGKASQSDT